MKSHVIATIEGLQSKVDVSRVKYSSVIYQRGEEEYSPI
jgi:hypothetical protein